MVFVIPWEAVDRELAKVMSFYWVNFIINGDPGGKALPHWPVYTTTGNQVIILGVKQEAKPIPDKAALDFMYQKTRGARK